MKNLALFASACTVAALSACTTGPMAPPMMVMKVDNAALPEPVRVPAGHKQMMAATGVGEITYECREKKDMAGQHEWAFVGPAATLFSGDKKAIGKYYAGPTWEANDGSKVTGKQVAMAPATPGSIPLQLVKTDPAVGAGAMTGVNYIQRLNTTGKRQQVAYEADYVFYGM